MIVFVIFAIVFLGLLVALHELGHYALARLTGMKVMTFSVGFARPIFKWTSSKTDITYQIGAVPLGGFVQVKGMNPFEDGAFDDASSFQMKAVWKRALVILAGPVANLLVAWIMIFVALVGVGLTEYVDDPVVGNVVQGGPAAQAGLREGDRVVSVNGKPMKTFAQVAQQMHVNPGTPVHLSVARNGDRRMVSVTPRANSDGVGLIGIEQSTRQVTHDPTEAALFALTKCYTVVRDTVVTLGRVITGRSQQAVTLAGPPAIVNQTAQAIQQGASTGLASLAFISLMLFLFNLLPIPALDGGRIAFLAYELVSGKRVNKRVDAVLNTVFFFVLMGLIAVVSLREMMSYFWD